MTGPEPKPTPTGGDPEPFAGLDLDEPLIDEETWQKAGRAMVATDDETT